MSLISKISKFFKKSNPGTEKENKIKVHDYIAKRVKQNGNDIGESIAVEEKRFIVKNSEITLSIPFEVVVENNENIVVGDFNREESFQLGKEWFDRRDTLKFDQSGMLIK